MPARLGTLKGVFFRLADGDRTGAVARESAMRLYTIPASVLLALLSLAPGARACGSVAATCPPPLSIFPAYTAEGARIGTVEAPVRLFPQLQRSRFTGQPLTVLFNNPGSRPGAVDPNLRLVPLPRVKAFETQAVYPRGY